jgi:hypothetical protein
MSRCPLFAAALALGACAPAAPNTLLNGAEVVAAPVYLSTTASRDDLPTPRPWIPIDLAVSPQGRLWVVQRLDRHPDFNDQTECTSRSVTGEPNDCGSLIGATVAITDPHLPVPATEDAGRAWFVVDFNAWHFMRRPSAIVFGAPEAWIEPDDPGARNPDTGASTLDGPTMYPDTFVTCSEHFTGNYTDQGPFNGPTLWTADPDIYNGRNGPYSWSNGSHLDMVHATSYCMGAAWDAENRYWLFNGELGTVDHYDFGAPHVPGHFYHMDAVLRRFDLGPLALTREVDAPSNLIVVDGDLLIADTGGGRVTAVDTSDNGQNGGPFYSSEGLAGELRSGVGARVVLSQDRLREAWGVAPKPTGLTELEPGVLAVASGTTGHLTLFTPQGEVLRTLDTGVGAGMGGLVAIDGALYVAHREDRRVLRFDLAD